MRYYKIRAEHIRASGTPKEGLVAVSLGEVQSRMTEELKEAHGDEKLGTIAAKVKGHSITFNKDYSKKTVYAHNVPLIYRDAVRAMFSDYNVLFEP